MTSKTPNPDEHAVPATGDDGPAGITMADLPPANTSRWVIRRKAIVVAAVRGGLITLDDACRRYALSEEEFLSWQQAIDTHGVRGLRATRTQLYRKIGERGAQGTAPSPSRPVLSAKPAT
jgi:hypothetical protein